MRCVLFFSCLLLAAGSLGSQTKEPYILRSHEKRAEKHIHAYLRHDTLVETSQADIHLYYSNDSTKPYLLMLHGMGVDAKTNWFRQVPDLSKHYNLIVPDLIYFGKSVSRGHNFSPEFQAYQIYEALQELEIHQPVYVMGFSYGGLIAALYNEYYPEHVKKLILIDAPVKFFSLQMADSVACLAGVNSMTNIIIPQTVEDFNAMQKAVISKRIPATRTIKLKVIDFYFSPTLKVRQHQLNYLSKHQARYQRYDYNLDSTSTLLIWGKRDGVVPVSVGERLHAMYPKTTKLLIFRKAKHDCHFSYSARLNKSIVNFLNN